MRWSAPGVVARPPSRSGCSTAGEAATGRGGGGAGRRPAFLPATTRERAVDRRIAALAATVALRRHARGGGTGERAGRDLRDVRLLVGSGGVLRHAPRRRGGGARRRSLADHAGGWALPRARARGGRRRLRAGRRRAARRGSSGGGAGRCCGTASGGDRHVETRRRDTPWRDTRQAGGGLTGGGGAARTVFESYHGKRLLFASSLRPLAERHRCSVVVAAARSSGRGSAGRREPVAVTGVRAG